MPSSPLPSSESFPSVSSLLGAESKNPIADRSIAWPRDVEMALHVPSLWPLRCAIRFGPEISLQRTNLEVALEIGSNALRCGDRPRKSGVVRHFMQEGSAAQRAAIGQRGRPFGRVKNDLNLAVFDGVDDVRPPFGDFIDLDRGDAVFGKIALGSRGRHYAEA